MIHQLNEVRETTLALFGILVFAFWLEVAVFGVMEYVAIIWSAITLTIFVAQTMVIWWAEFKLYLEEK